MPQITFKGEPVSTVGTLPPVGSELKSFILVKNDLSETTLADYKGKKLVLNIFPSIDTGTCATSVRSFNERAAGLENTVVLNISKDLPFAQKRFCGAEGINNVETLSDFRGTFGNDYGVRLADSPLKGLLSRAIVVADGNGKILYTEQVTEITSEPNYEAAIAALGV